MPPHNISLQDKIPHFSGLFWFLKDTPPPPTHKIYLKNHWPYTPQTYVYTLNFIKMQDPNFAGHLA